MNIQPLLDSLKAVIKEKLTYLFGLEDDEVALNHLYRLETEFSEDDNNPYVDIYLHIEMGYEDFYNLLATKLDEIVQSADPSSYWDAVDGGQFMCRIYENPQEYERPNENPEVYTDENLKKLERIISNHLEEYTGIDTYPGDVEVVHFDSEKVGWVVGCFVETEEYDTRGYVETNPTIVDYSILEDFVVTYLLPKLYGNIEYK